MCVFFLYIYFFVPRRLTRTPDLGHPANTSDGLFDLTETIHRKKNAIEKAPQCVIDNLAGCSWTAPMHLTVSIWIRRQVKTNLRWYLQTALGTGISAHLIAKHRGGSAARACLHRGPAAGWCCAPLTPYMCFHVRFCNAEIQHGEEHAQIWTWTSTCLGCMSMGLCMFC